jgi:hypothetical protein
MASTLTAKRNKPAIPPFWHRLPQVLTYPLNPESLMWIGIWTFTIVLLIVVGAMFFGIGFVLAFFAYMGFLRYAFKVLTRTARGHLTAEHEDFEGRGEADYRPYKQVAIFFFLLILVGIARSTMGVVGEQIALLLMAIVLPAAIMILALEDSVGAALHPSRLLDFIRGVGLPYFTLVAFLFLMLQGSALMGALLGKLLPMWLAVFVVVAVNMYFTVSMYYLMGYVLFQYHSKLDVDVDITHEEAARTVTKTASEPSLLGPETTGLLENGDLAAAAERIMIRLRREWDNHRLHDQYLKLLGHGGSEAYIKHAKAYLPTLLKEQRIARALEIYEACRQKDNAFQLTDGNSVIALAQHALESNRARTAMGLIQGFDKRFPGHARIAAAYLIGGRLQLEHLHQYETAKRTLGAVVQNYPNDPVAKDAAQFLKIAVGMAAQASPSPPSASRS